MKWGNVLVFGILHLVTMIHLIHAQTCPEFDVIEPESDEWDESYHPIGDTDARPIGFKAGTVIYNGPANQNPCAKISGVQGRTVEILFETVPSSTLCLTKSSNVQGEICESTGRYTDCMLVNDDSLEVQFSCSPGQGCSESDVTFWYRLTKSPSLDLDGHWCADRANRYPQDLLRLPTNAPIPPVNDGDDNGAVLTSVVSLPVLGVLSWIALNLW